MLKELRLKIEVENEQDETRLKMLDGMTVVLSRGCSKHRAGVLIVVADREERADAGCILSTLDAVSEEIQLVMTPLN